MSDGVSRQAIVDSLDALGERDRLTYDQRNAGNADAPYPPTVVDQRLTALRRRRWIACTLFGLSALIVAVTCLGVPFDWSITEFVAGLLLATVPMVGHGVRLLVYCRQAETLYRLLRTTDEGAAAHAGSAPVEVSTAR